MISESTANHTGDKDDPVNVTPAWSPHEEEELRRIATQRSVRSVARTTGPGNAQSPKLDPTSPEFNLMEWMLHEVRQFEEHNTGRKTGVIFKNLTVQGAGSDIQPQHTVTLSAETNGLEFLPETTINYDRISQSLMKNNFMGDILYSQEVEKLGETLEFAAAARAPRQIPDGMTKKGQIEHMRDVVMTVFGLSHTINTKVGSDFIRGVSGGERKRVSIAEMVLANSPVCCWDNSTRGLDSASSLDFVKALKKSSTIFGTTHLATLCQPSQAIYNLFNQVAVLYQGHEIFFGSTSEAKQYFQDMGWQSKGLPGFESKVPRTPEEFEARWRSSYQCRGLIQEIEDSIKMHGADSESVNAFKESHPNRQAKYTRSTSPYLLSIPSQVSICLRRFYQRTWNDIASTATLMIGQVVFSLIIGSLYYGTPFGTQAMTLRMSALFFAILLNSLLTVAEIQSLYFQRPIVEKHASYAFYHPFSEALAGVCADIPIKLGTSLVFNVVFYFMCGLRYEVGPFFIYCLFVTLSLLCMSQIFRSLAAATKAIPQALAAAGVILLAAVIYTEYMLPEPNMHPWFRWISYINPLRYAFEALAVNELHGRDYPCSSVVPAYPGFVTGSSKSFICAEKGALAGELFVSGDSYLLTSYGYEYSHLWRNFGILCGFTIAFLVLYLILVEFNSGSSSSAESLVFLHGKVSLALQNSANDSRSSTTRANQEHVASEEAIMPPQTDTFTWRNVCYDIQIKKENRRLLDNVSGWVEPGTLTALINVSGAGKTTLLNILAQRISVGVLTGDMLVNGYPLSASFERNTGYVQQQDLHLHTATVLIRMLNMEEYAEALVGFPGEGLNLEQRKLLTIGVELAEKPALLSFLDEPTSGLDSQSSWSIVAPLRRLASSGQAVLCTIHQPSAMLFQQFDPLLFLAKGARVCHDSENPAEYILEIADAKGNGNGEKYWPTLWKSSREADEMMMVLDKACAEHRQGETSTTDTDANAASAFAMPFKEQFIAVLHLFVGFSFYQPGTSEQGLQSIIFSVFMMTAIFTAMVQQIMPQFIFQRDLYEVRERPSKTYHWAAFLGANILAEIPQIFVGIVVYASFVYSVYGVVDSQRQGILLLLIVQFFLYGSTFAHAVVAVLPDAETAGLFATMLFNMTLVFNGVLVSKAALPGFWYFMYRVSPMTYLVNAIIATGASGRPVNCSKKELSVFEMLKGYASCADYLEVYLQAAGDAAGKLLNPDSTDQCEYCTLQTADQYLASLDISYSTRWRNSGLLWVHVGFNIFFTLVVYYLCRVRPSKRKA
ncbi:uncharacterized protein N7483_003333 [Penicillium malachiteum]|uniref:uncharacterized protein n=1 Tax=Penicillium malachiteum TaxID=1324776 RepID=UPI00254801AB|nr:uncharacterized protein N7483_003333 [Penicillium malachiteum]KAJ5728825.1 hypothetical protein N7483_003333 [Penicillium malachiteum]